MHIADPATTSPDLAALLRINLTYAWRHRRLPKLTAPTLFTELVQQRKLHDRNPRLPLMADKIAAKAEVAARLGRDWIVPTLWSGQALPAESIWAQPIVVKSRHGCNQNAFVHDARRDWAAIRDRTNRWMRTSYGGWLDEWLYEHIPRGLLIEPFIGQDRRLPIDYKIYVFGGQATHVQVHLDRASRHRWIMHDIDWRPSNRSAPVVPPPSGFAAMVAAAEELGRGVDFVRVDFYQPGQRPLFGEMSFYPGSGLDPFDPPSLDAELGALWLDARRRGPWHAGDTIRAPLAA